MLRFATLLLALAASLAAQPASYVPKLRDVLDNNILKFWYPRSLDTERGGYHLYFKPDGTPGPAGPKMIVGQSRMVWFFARMARAGYGDKAQMLAAAEHGYKFLMARMWDAKNGGFHWEVDATGATRTREKKHLYGNAFALYALSEYALASGRKDVLAAAQRQFDALEKHAHDAEFGGYREYFNADWSTPPPDENGYMSVPHDVKLMNTHLHLLEAMTTFYRASKLPLAKDRLAELVNIETSAVYRTGLAAATDRYARDWTPLLEGRQARNSYGHDVENVWLVADALNALGQPVRPFLELFDENWRYCLKYGWDDAKGGFYYTGWFRQPADDLQKSWWVQSETLVSALYMFRLTGNPLYWRAFEATWDLLDRSQIDYKNGEWHATVTPDGRGVGDKGQQWKTAYHNGRAMIECLALLPLIDAETEKGFVSLFDGKSLNGWTLVRPSGRGYVVENGAIVCPKDGGGNLYTEKEYANFVLRLDWRLWEGGNNGLGIRAPLQGDAAYQGMELQILDDEAEVYRRMGLRPAQYTGSVYDVFAARRGMVKRDGVWNSEEVTVNGRRVKVVLNGEVISDVNLDEVKDPAVLKRHPGLARASGHIGFLGHGTRVEFRNIRVKTLP